MIIKYVVEDAVGYVCKQDGHDVYGATSYLECAHRFSNIAEAAAIAANKAGLDRCGATYFVVPYDEEYPKYVERETR